MRTSGPLACLLGLGLVVACSTGDSFAERVRAACEHLYDVHAQRNASCGGASLGSVADYVDTCTVNATAPGSGTTIAQLAKCADDLESTKACSPLQVPSCAAAPGTIEEGGPGCGTDAQCRSRHCVRIMEGTCGKCFTIVPEGYRCVADERCEPGLHCDLGICRKRKLVDVGGSCTPDDICAIGSFCGSSAVCTLLPGEGQDCPNGACASGLYCKSGKCAPRLDAGATCKVFECKEGLLCDPDTQKCVALATANEGEPCIAQYVRCANGLRCLPTGCAPLGRRGTACDVPSDCASPLTCINQRCTIADPARCQ